MEIGHLDLDKVNPDWRAAYFHAKSVKPGTFSHQTPDLCDCCLNVIHKNPVPICIHAKQLEFMGFGFPLWYAFLKNCAILILILIASDTIISIYKATTQNYQFCHHLFQKQKNLHNHQLHFQSQNYQQSLTTSNIHFLRTHYQHSDPHQISNQKDKSPFVKNQPHNENGQQGHELHCTGIFIYLSRIQKQIDTEEKVLRISSFFIQLIALLFIRDTLSKTEQYYDQRRCSLSDYSVIISRLPKMQGIQKALRKFFKQQFSHPVVIQEMILIPEYQEIQELQQEKNHQLKKMQKYMAKGEQQYKSEIQQHQNQIRIIEQELAEKIHQFKEQIITDKLPSERAVIIVSTQHQKQRVLDQFEQMDQNNFEKYFGHAGTMMQMNEAPEPRQIIWENINYPSGKRAFRVFLGWLFSFIFIALVTLVFYFVLRFKTYIVEQKQDNGSHFHATLLVYIAIFCVILFNKFVMGNVLHAFTHFQKHRTSDRQEFSFAFKYALGMFFTTALMTLFVQAITYENFYKHPFGVIEQQSIMFFMNSFLIPLIWLINPFQISVLIKRKLNFGKKYLTQREANIYMQDFHYDTGKRYAEILQTMWFTFLYCTLIPMGSFLTLIGLFLYYWVDKYNLLRRSSLHENVSGKLCLVAMKLLDGTLILRPIGQLIFDHYLRDGVSLQSIIMLFIALIYLLIPMNRVLDYVNQELFILEQKPYKQAKISFKDTYFNLHPIYSKTHSRQNHQSRRIFKEQALSQLANPIFSFALGFLAKGKKDIK